MEDVIEIVKVTFSRAGKVWWSIIWRTCLVAFAFGFVLALVKVTIPSETVLNICRVIVAWLVIFSGILVIGSVLEKKYSDFRITLVEKDYEIKDKQQLGNAEMETIEVTGHRALKVWWCLWWRTIMITVLANAAVESLFLVVASFVGEEVSEGFIIIVTLRIGVFYVFPILVSMAVVQSVLRKTYSDFKIVLVEKSEASQEQKQ